MTKFTVTFTSSLDYDLIFLQDTLLINFFIKKQNLFVQIANFLRISAKFISANFIQI